MIFSKLGEYEACGVFTLGHLVLLSVTLICVCSVLYFTVHKRNDEIKEIIKRCTIGLWILEIIKIAFNLLSGNKDNLNSYIPLYFCSLILYAGLFSTYGKGIFKRAGDIFLATGGVVAGICFMLVPLTSLTNYPMFHFISIQSFILHGTMVYIGLLVNITKYVEYGLKDFAYYFFTIFIFGIVAYIFNLTLNTNLMFISQNYPNTPIESIYNTTGRLFPIIMLLSQAILPYFAILLCKNVSVKILENIKIYVRENNKYAKNFHKI